jgi:hypothetical protein
MHSKPGPSTDARSWIDFSKDVLEVLYIHILLHNGGFYNGCIRKRCLKNSTIVPLNDVVHSMSVMKDESNKNV